MPRLGHKKSRNGCRQCKARHVKCDEKKPCSSCARHGVQCSLVTLDPYSTASAPPEAANSASTPRPTRTLSERPKSDSSRVPTPASLPIEDILNPSPAPAAGAKESGSPDPFPYLTKLVNKCDTVQPDYWVRDLELMHHWATEAYSTLSQRDDYSHLWKIVAPKHAVRHTFLMHELLAFSALHLAHLQPEKQRSFYALGIHHQDLAIRSMRAVLLRVSADNASTLFATSILVALTVFASTGLDALSPSPNGQPVFDDLLDIFALLKGMGHLLSSVQSIVLDGPFAPILHHSPIDMPPQPIFPVLYERMADAMTFIEHKEVEETARMECMELLANFHNLIPLFMIPHMDNRELRLLLFWPLHIGPDFAKRLRQRHPAVLVIIAHYAVVLKAAEPNSWFMKGWGERLIRAISEAIDPSWQPVIEWPLHYIQAQQEQKQQQQQQEQSAST